MKKNLIVFLVCFFSCSLIYIHPNEDLTNWKRIPITTTNFSVVYHLNNVSLVPKQRQSNVTNIIPSLFGNKYIGEVIYNWDITEDNKRSGFIQLSIKNLHVSYKKIDDTYKWAGTDFSESSVEFVIGNMNGEIYRTYGEWHNLNLTIEPLIQNKKYKEYFLGTDGKKVFDYKKWNWPTGTTVSIEDKVIAYISNSMDIGLIVDPEYFKEFSSIELGLIIYLGIRPDVELRFNDM